MTIKTTKIIAPSKLESEIPRTKKSEITVISGREEIKRILSKEDKRLMVITGPCSVHDERAALEYAEKLLVLREKFKDTMCIVMRVYFEKPRTTIGWKGLINDPHMDGSCDIMEGLRRARRLLIRITEMGMPVATEFLDPLAPRYLEGLVSWVAIGARTTESQTHRELASGLAAPVGFKNGTDGGLEIAINAMIAAGAPQSFLGIDPLGNPCVIRTSGNPYAHLVLRGGKKRPNYDGVSVANALKSLERADKSGAVIVDCSHANSNKDFRKQREAWQDVIEQRIEGNNAIVGLMLESNLCEGSQQLSADPSQLRYGVSITDGCISWQETEELLWEGYCRLRGTEKEQEQAA